MKEMITRTIVTTTIKTVKVVMIENKPEMVEQPDIIVTSTCSLSEKKINKIMTKYPHCTVTGHTETAKVMSISLDDFLEKATEVTRSPSQCK